MLTIVLLLLAAVAVVLFARLSFIGFRKRQNSVAQQMGLASSICEAAARDAFDVELDHSLDSLAKLDELIEQGFTGVLEVTDDTVYVLAAYYGQVLVHACGAEWQSANGQDAKPTLKIGSTLESISPFEMIERKLHAPQDTNLAAEARELMTKIESVNGNAN